MIRFTLQLVEVFAPELRESIEPEEISGATGGKNSNINNTLSRKRNNTNNF